ncbi:hypothetical protein ACYUUK_006104, partial [Pseudomonas aeruginosa]|uniref:hypothetical protein n=1 Tax=Pseudomonas aeruginosa TaxID=287 RepID=UPI001C8CE20C
STAGSLHFVEFVVKTGRILRARLEAVNIIFHRNLKNFTGRTITYLPSPKNEARNWAGLVID